MRTKNHQYEQFILKVNSLSKAIKLIGRVQNPNLKYNFNLKRNLIVQIQEDFSILDYHQPKS